MDEQTTMFGYMLLAVIVISTLGRNQVVRSGRNTRPQGYVLVPSNKISNWTRWQAKERMYICDENHCSTGQLRSGYAYFEGPNYRYAVYYDGRGRYTVYGQKKW